MTGIGNWKRKGEKMREMKFRCWHKTAKEMLFENRLGKCFQWLSEGQPIKIMQFTGLYDKNGKEIWEGDIVKNSTGRIMELAWFSSPSYAGWDLRVICAKGTPPISRSLWEELEVIGNIYEDPELLEK